MSIEALPTIEQKALYLLLSGKDISCQSLRAQLNHVVKLNRTETGAGVYVDFEFNDSVQPLVGRDSFHISGVYAVSIKCEEIGFLLFVKNGLISLLEAFVSADVYPSYADCDFKLESIERGS